jgi:hypothetical protein
MIFGSIAIRSPPFLENLVYTILFTPSDDEPKIDGDQIVLETELRFPRDWKPDNLARSENGSGCWAQKSR